MEAAGGLVRAWRKGTEWALSLVLPRVCAGCGGLSESARSICVRCRDGMLTESVAPELPEGVASLKVGVRLEGCARRMIHGLKYEGRRAVARDLAELMVARGMPTFPAGSALVPVPITSTRRRERGYNQSEVLARELGARLGIPVVPDFLVRTRFRGSQTKKTGEERREALSGMFARGRGFRGDAIPFLVDDVLTTGATLSACAAASLHGGVREVHALCAAWAGDA